MELSIIIPAYNVEKYIVKCLDSLLMQQVLDCEIIVINDGSTDNTSNVVNEYITNTSKNILLINSQNEGQGIARNRGIELAKGKYIMFVDADDYVMANSLHLLINRMNSENLDILCGNYEKVDLNGKVIPKNNIEKVLKFTSNVVDAPTFLSENFGFLCYTWTFIYKTEFIKHLDVHFKGKIYLEDTEWLSRIIVNAKRISMLNISFYNYVQTPTSSMRDIHKFEKRINDTLLVTELLKKFQLEYVHNRKINAWYNEMISINAIMLISATKKPEYRDYMSIVLSEMIVLDLFPLQINRMPIQFKIASKIINFIWFFYKLIGRPKQFND